MTEMRTFAPILVYDNDGNMLADMVEVEPFNGLWHFHGDVAAEIRRLLDEIERLKWDIENIHDNYRCQPD
jgi:hypothetical protein